MTPGREVAAALRVLVPRWRALLTDDARARGEEDAVSCAYAELIRTVAWRCLDSRGHTDGGHVVPELRGAFDRLGAGAGVGVRTGDRDGAGAGSGTGETPGPLSPLREQLATELAELPAAAFTADELLGRVHQHFHDQDRAEVFERSKRRGGKVGGADLPAATQVFTEPEMVAFLIQNSLGARWLAMHPDSRLASRWLYLVRDVSPARREPVPVRDWRLLDPAVGAGSVLFGAFDLLVELYEEERALASRGLLPADQAVPEADVAAAVLGRNLAGIDIDRAPVRLAAFVLGMKALEHGADAVPRMQLVSTDVVPLRGEAGARPFDRPPDESPALRAGLGLAAAEALGRMRSELEAAPVLGCLVRPEADGAPSLAQLSRLLGAELPRTDDVAAELFVTPPPAGSQLLELLRRRYDVVTTNPPFVGFRILGPEVKDAVTARDPLAAQDLHVAVLNRCWELLAEDGTGAWVSPENWCNASRLTGVRRRILEGGGPRVVASLGTGAFDGILSHIALSVVERGRRPRTLAVLAGDLEGQPRHYPRELIAGHELMPFVLRLPPSMLRSRQELSTVGDHFVPRDGLWSGDNTRDARFWWEVGPGDERWVPVATGGYGRWYAPVESVYRKESVGADEVARSLAHRRAGFAYLRVAFGRLCARVVDPGTAAQAGVVSFAPCGEGDGTGPGPAPLAEGEGADRGAAPPVAEALAVFNSRVGTACLRDLVTGINFNAGYARMVPIPRDESLRGPVGRAVAAKRRLADASPTSWAFRDAPFPTPAALDERRRVQADLLDAEGEVERSLAAALDIDEEGLAHLEEELGTPAAWYAAPTPSRDREVGGGATPGPLMPETELERRCHELRLPPRSVLAAGLDDRGARREMAEDWLSVLVLRILGHRWPCQDRYEEERGAPFLDAAHVAPGGHVPLTPGMGAPTLVERVRSVLAAVPVEDLPGWAPDEGSHGGAVRGGDLRGGAVRGGSIDGADVPDEAPQRCGSLARLGTALGGDLEGWLGSRFFRRHVRTFGRRPVAWQLTSPGGSVGLLVLHRRLDRRGLRAVRTGPVATLRAAGTYPEEVGSLDTALATLETGSSPDARIRPPWRAPPPAGWDPDPDDGIGVNIAPLQRLGLLPCAVLSERELDRLSPDPDGPASAPAVSTHAAANG